MQRGGDPVRHAQLCGSAGCLSAYRPRSLYRVRYLRLSRPPSNPSRRRQALAANSRRRDTRWSDGYAARRSCLARERLAAGWNRLRGDRDAGRQCQFRPRQAHPAGDQKPSAVCRCAAARHPRAQLRAALSPGSRRDPGHLHQDHRGGRPFASAVATPEDLVQPRPEDPAYAARRQTVVDKYRQGQDPSTTYTQNTGAKISTVGSP
jgi:hypothetical protein